MCTIVPPSINSNFQQSFGRLSRLRIRTRTTSTYISPRPQCKNVNVLPSFFKKEYIPNYTFIILEINFVKYFFIEREFVIFYTVQTPVFAQRFAMVD